MQKTTTFYIKTLILILGALILLISGFLPTVQEVYYGYPVNGNNGYNHIEGTIGFISPLWYSIFVATIIVFSIGYFFNNTVNIALFFVFTPVFAFVILFFTISSTFSLDFHFGGGGPSSKTELGDGHPIAIAGALLIVIATCISVLRKKQKKIESSDLLDSLD